MELTVQGVKPRKLRSRRILGIKFFNGTAKEAIARMRNGGLLVVPAAPALKDLTWNAPYRDALLNADLAITDSSFMVMIWNLIQHDSVSRLSGLEYLRELLLEDDVREQGNTFWIMASRESSERNLVWLKEQGVEVAEKNTYVAPVYGNGRINDPQLLEKISAAKPRHIIVTVGGGTQERLGIYLKRNLSYLPAIHCIGAAIAFLSGDQVRIPALADKLYLGWFFRSLSDPMRFIPRYWNARLLFGLLVRYRHELPPLMARFMRPR